MCSRMRTLLKRLSTRPLGFVWKNARGACITVRAMRWCMRVPARRATPKNRKLRKTAMSRTLPVKAAYTDSYLEAATTPA